MHYVCCICGRMYDCPVMLCPWALQDDGTVKSIDGPMWWHLARGQANVTSNILLSTIVSFEFYIVLATPVRFVLARGSKRFSFLADINILASGSVVIWFLNEETSKQDGIRRLKTTS